MIPPISYIDRKTGQRRVEPVYAMGFLHWAYNTRSGATAGRLLFRTRFFSSLYGWWNSTPMSRHRIPGFIRRMEIDMRACPRRPNEFGSFNDFFRRRIDLAARPFDADPAVCISPVDGKAVAYPCVGAAEQIRVKCHSLSVHELLGDPEAAGRFDGGAVVVIRLGLADYHHVHFPADGIPEEAAAIGGAYHAGGPYALAGIVPFFSHNYRMRTLFHTDGFGPIAMVEVGAFTVGSIVQTYTARRTVRRGEPKAYFELGGSTVVLVFRPGMFRPDDDIVRNTREGLETSVQVGESIGRRPS